MEEFISLSEFSTQIRSLGTCKEARMRFKLNQEWNFANGLRSEEAIASRFETGFVTFTMTFWIAVLVLFDDFKYGTWQLEHLLSQCSLTDSVFILPRDSQNVLPNPTGYVSDFAAQ